MQPASLQELRAAWLESKARETAAREDRLAIETAIVARFEKKPEGTVTDKDAGISVTFKQTRSVNTAALQSAWATLPANAQRAFKWSADLDTKHYRALVELGAPEFQQIAPFITTKDAKPSVEIKGD